MNTAPPKSFNPWPLGIAAFLACFFCAMVAIVVFSRFHRLELVTANYYQQEVEYQQQIDRLERTRTLAPDARIAYDEAARRIEVRIPTSHVALKPEGTVHFYRPASTGLDRHIGLAVDSLGVQTFDASDLQAGKWKVRVAWKAGGREYFLDQPVVIPAQPKPVEVSR